MMGLLMYYINIIIECFQSWDRTRLQIEYGIRSGNKSQRLTRNDKKAVRCLSCRLETRTTLQPSSLLVHNWVTHMNRYLSFY